VRAIAALARLLIRDGRPAEALTVARDLVEKRPEDGEARALLGEAILETGDPAEAVPLLERSLELDARPAVRRSLARALARSGQVDAALKVLDDGGSVAAEDDLLKGNILRESGRHQDAVAAYDAVIATGAHLDVAYAERARALEDLGRIPEALASLDAAIGLDPGEAEVWREHGAVALKAGRSKAALRSLERATELDPHDWEAWALRAKALEALGRGDEAARCRERAQASIASEFGASTDNDGEVLK